MDEVKDIAEIADATEVQPAVVAEVKKVNSRRVKVERKARPRKAATEAHAVASENTAPQSAQVAPVAAALVEAPAIQEQALDLAEAAEAAVKQVESLANHNQAAAAAAVKESTMNYDATNWMNQFATALPGADKFQSLFSDAGERGQQWVEKSQKVAGEMVELTRANVEAVVESGKIAAAGAQTLGQEALARTRENFEQTAQQVRSLTQAGSPTEYFQLQSEIARTQFDRLVAEGSRFAESMVKLAGEAFQPLSNRAALNAERVNELTV